MFSTGGSITIELFLTIEQKAVGAYVILVDLSLSCRCSSALGSIKYENNLYTCIATSYSADYQENIAVINSIKYYKYIGGTPLIATKAN